MVNFGNSAVFFFHADVSNQISGLSMNILSVGDKSLVEKGFFSNSAADLLPALGFLGGLYNFCSFIIFSLM